MDWRQHQQEAAARFLQPKATVAPTVMPPPQNVAAMKQRAISNKININSASARDLESLPRVGPVMAQRILSFRKDHGPFQSIDELRQIKGIGEKTLARIRDRITIE
jgi:competence protein ComEA